MFWFTVEIPIPPVKSHICYEIKKEEPKNNLGYYFFYCKNCDGQICISHKLRPKDKIKYK